MRPRKNHIGHFIAQYALYASTAGAWLAYVGSFPLRFGIAGGLAFTLMAGLAVRISGHKKSPTSEGRAFDVWSG